MGNLSTAPGFGENAFPALTVVLGAVLVVGFGGLVVFQARRSSNGTPQALSLEHFLTARRSIGWSNTGWSLYASAVGSGAITAPAEFGFFVGVLGVLAYALATALPLLMIAFFGPKIHKMYPHLLSLSHFIGFRFGPITQVMVVGITVLNMAAATVAEYTTLASLYGDFVGLDDFTVFFVILMAVTTLSYTAYGGLKASIITDQAQAACSVFLVIFIILFVTIDFDRDEIRQQQREENITVSDFNFTHDMLGLNYGGYSTLFTLPLSLATATIFSEAMWQRSWAAETDASLKKGAVMGSTLVFCLVATFGGIGIVVRWAGLITDDELEDFNPNLFAFQIFSSQRDKALVSSGIGVLVLMLATTLNEGALDSLQNGIEASVSGALSQLFSESNNLKLARVLLILLNIPFIIIGLQRFNILSVFLLANMVCVCAFFPITLGFAKIDILQDLHRDWIPPTTFGISLIAVCIFAEINFDDLGEGMKYAFWGNTLYEYDYFLFGLVVSITVTGMIYAAMYYMDRREKQREGDNSKLSPIGVMSMPDTSEPKPVSL